MRLGKLPYITLWAVEFEEIKTLYKKTLGLPVVEENPNFIMFETKGSRLAFHKLKTATRLNRPTVELHLEVNDVDEVYTALQQKGIKFEEKPANRPWGTRMASFRDPEGYMIEIIGPVKNETTLNETPEPSKKPLTSATSGANVPHGLNMDQPRQQP